MRGLGHRTNSGFLAMTVASGLLAAAPGSEGFACGYEDPQSVSRGSLSWSYPDSLYVIGAISQEVAAGRLPFANFDRPGIDLFGHKFLLAANCLARFAALLDAGSPQSLRRPVAVVLVEPMLWARFEPMADGLHTAVHVSGPEHGDLVIITGKPSSPRSQQGTLLSAKPMHAGCCAFTGTMPRSPYLSGTINRSAEPTPRSSRRIPMAAEPRRTERTSVRPASTRPMPTMSGCRSREKNRPTSFRA